MAEKKVFPMGETTKTARQRADSMLARGAGVLNSSSSEDEARPVGQGVYDPDDRGSAPSIVAK